MGWDDEDEWPEPDRDPESLERRRRAIGEVASARRRLLRWAYAGLGILLIVVIVLALTR
jgi:hypothetical protein